MVVMMIEVIWPSRSPRMLRLVRVFMMMVMMVKNIIRRIHRRRIFGDAHSRCYESQRYEKICYDGKFHLSKDLHSYV